MNTRSETNCDLDRFYSAESVSEWQEIIGGDLHYHFGYFRGSEDLETGLKQTVRNFYPYIPAGTRVLDIGCGWGGPAKMLISDRNCSVTGISLSSTQVEYCQSLGLNVWQQDLELETEEIRGEYDLIFCLEMMSHIRNKARLLERLRSLAPRLLLSVNCITDNYWGERTTFGESMELCTVSELTQYLEQAGWQINYIKNKRFQSLRTIALWKENLDRVYGDRQPPGQLAILRALVDAALRDPVGWCQSFPLIDIVAER
ncbi:class I SAM-dependent methyltransferase [Roseofilum reptotaenium CS-1145]|uniref:Methyltransferase n=1 Tax=Roseofilum reptotaenium AO1-A TaxID=1925591 RepID=A0A1L9QWG3_9CYAN|nr:class I SAM-dependent methyltransferase [Roseofilum reptotaenium]MDB9518585.1 class I SAM-dependent methyltransferase [Roseofilum reptotaenium CS-1145]OJJ27020.1 methyltransferase [Roseofilum reptotaenium AO1-A]